MTRDHGEFLYPSSPLFAFLAFTVPFCVLDSPSNQSGLWRKRGGNSPGGSDPTTALVAYSGQHFGYKPRWNPVAGKTPSHFTRHHGHRVF